MMRFTSFVVTTLAFMASLAGAARAQATMPGSAPQTVDRHPTTLRGVVGDADGAPVQGVAVTVYRDDNKVAEDTTDAQGGFHFDAPPRSYRVALTAPGFLDLHSSAIPFSARGVSHFTLLHPGQMATAAQAGYVHGAAARAPLEFGALAQGGFGTGDRSSYRFFLLGGHAGKVLTPELGTGWLRGNFEYAVEVFPFWQSYTPHFSRIKCSADPPAPLGTYTCSQPYTVGGTFTGVSITPIILRWNFTAGQRWMPWVQGAGGLVWTNHKYPAIGNLNPADTASNGPHGDTSVWNFTPQFGAGVHYFLRPSQSVDFSANAVHISSASLGDKNPGVNASVQLSVGYTWWK